MHPCRILAQDIVGEGGTEPAPGKRRCSASDKVAHETLLYSGSCLLFGSVLVGSSLHWSLFYLLPSHFSSDVFSQN